MDTVYYETYDTNEYDSMELNPTGEEVITFLLWCLHGNTYYVLNNHNYIIRILVAIQDKFHS